MLHASACAYRFCLMNTRLPGRGRSRLPLRYHSIQGNGLPSARQPSVMLPRGATWNRLVVVCTTAALAGVGEGKGRGKNDKSKI